MTAPPPVTGAGIQSFGYLVGDLNSAAQARKAVGTGVRKKTPEPDSAEAPALRRRPRNRFNRSGVGGQRSNSSAAVTNTWI